jgi:ABC-2 type transport system permease protein
MKTKSRGIVHGFGIINHRLSMYLSIVYLGLKSKFTYRLSSFLDMLGRLIEFLGWLFIWATLLKDGGRFGTSMEEMVTYLVITRLVLTLTASTAGDEIARKIRDGSISTDFVRPINMKGFLFFNDIGNNLFKAFAVFLPIGIITALGFGFVPPQGLPPFLAFLFTMFLGAVLRFYYEYLLGLISFWLVRNPFLKWHFKNVANLFAGQFLPIWLYPAALATVTLFLPFRYFTYEPIALCLGKSPLSELPRILTAQVLWLGILYLAERLIWRSAYRKVVVQGG